MSRLLIITLLSLYLHNSLAFAQRSFDQSSIPEDLRQELLQKFPQITGSEFTMRDLDRIVRFAAATGRFESVAVIQTGGDQGPYSLVYETNKTIGEIQFTGNSQISDGALRDHLDFSEGDFFRRPNMDSTIQKLTHFYQQRAFLNAKISYELREQADSGVQIEFFITEGARAQVNEIVVQSTNLDLNKQLTGVLRKFRGRAITEPNLAEFRDRATDYLRARGYYQANLNGPEMTMAERGAKLSYTIQNPIRFSIQTSGNSGLSTSNIIRSLDLNNFFSPNPSIGGVLANRIEHHYLSRGYAHIEVTSTIKERADSHMKTIHFTIKEGPRVKIGDINIRGSVSRPTPYYIGIIKDSAAPLTRSGYYNRQEFEDALNAVTIQLQNEGFLQARITSLRAEYTDNKDSINLSINLNEGPLTQVQEVLFEGNKEISDRQLKELIRLEPGAPLKLNYLEEDLANLKKFYRDQGFLEAEIINERKDLVHYNADHTLARVIFQLKEGPIIRVNDIALEGNRLTHDYVILNELDFEKGDVLTPAKINESIRRLQGAGYFANVDIQMREAQSEISERTIVVNVTERKPGLLNFGAGVTNERGATLRGYTGIAYRNLYGTGRAITARLDGKYNVSELQYPEYQFSIGYLEPYLLSSRYRGRVNVTRWEQVDEILPNTSHNGRSFTELNIARTDQVAFSVERDITANILFRWNLLELSSTQQFYLYGSQESFVQNIATLGPALDLDFRDHPFNPTSGSHTLFNIEYSSPSLGSSETIEFARATGSFTYYLRAYGPVIWANSVRGGYLQNLSDHPNGGVPYDRKGFFLGGASTIRGFEGREERFPLLRELTGDPTLVDYILRDSASYYLVKTELRFPLYWMIAGAVFLDGGQVLIENGPPSYDDSFRSSVGVAFRIGTPVGPVNLEYGHKLGQNKERGEKAGHIHITIGAF